MATPADREPIIESLVAAFPGDPVLRMLFPERYETYARAFFGRLFDKRVGRGSIWTIGGGASVAVWEPPADGTPDDAPGYDMPGYDVPDYDLPDDVLKRVHEYDEAVHGALPSTPFWYLGVLGTNPSAAGRGWGRRVMRAGLDRAAAEGLPSYLETSNPGNVELYRRAGWEVVEHLTAPLPIWIMKQ